MTAWDVAVIGGGVAGSTAAALLAQRKLRVILIERGALPRQKVCGEFLSPEGADVLRRLGVWPWVEAHHPPQIHRFTLSAGHREIRHTLPLPGWGVSRWVLDHVLWKYAEYSGVVTQAHSTVEEVTGDFQRGFSLTLGRAGQSTRLRARAVLCAAGRQWRLRGQPRVAHHRRGSRFVGLKAHFAGVPLDGHVELHAIRHGYCGMVEVTGGATNLCCWVESETLRRAGSTPDRFLASALAENSCLRMRLGRAQPIGGSWTTTSFAYGKISAPVVAGIWNIGDQAAMVAPLTGDGMGMGLRAAELAATMMQAAFWRECPWDWASTEYVRRWQREFLPRLRWGRGLEAMLLRPRLASLACIALSCVPSFMDPIYRRTRQLFPAIAPPREVL
ncbi:MAG TPA: FAD-dependent oxidoreductase [Candidatus Tectomicrobia bacterium]|nr:FAD-dependent oxidoreductase [Candidatus Tectomicrobia bacterium]